MSQLQMNKPILPSIQFLLQEAPGKEQKEKKRKKKKPCINNNILSKKKKKRSRYTPYRYTSSYDS